MKLTDPDSARQSALAELASLTSIEFGTLSETHRAKPSADGTDVVRRGPDFRHQCWENGRNRSTYIPPEQIGALRQDLENGRRFQQITGELATAAIQQSRARRAGAAPSLQTAEKKPRNTLSRRKIQRNRSIPCPNPAMSHPRKAAPNPKPTLRGRAARRLRP